MTSYNQLASSVQVINHMLTLADEKQAQHLMRFFKTQPGCYGFGDSFLGIKVPETRKVVAQSKDLPLSEIHNLLISKWHEVRLCGLLILVHQFETLCSKKLTNDPKATTLRDDIIRFYIEHAHCANNWDLVDLSVYKILGRWLITPSSRDNMGKKAEIDNLAASDNLWMQRMSIVCTLEPLKHNDPSFTLRYSEWHLHHTHDLMHKAVGWMLREMGKRVSMDLLREFLQKHYNNMPRTTLRYAIELMDIEERKQWMGK